MEKYKILINKVKLKMRLRKKKNGYNQQFDIEITEGTSPMQPKEQRKKWN